MGRTTFHIDEKETPVYTAILTDENGAVIPGASLTQALLTLYDVETGAIVNGRNLQNVLNANDVTIDAAGLLTWAIQIADVTLLVGAAPRAIHRALFQFFWQGNARHKPHEVELVIRNLDKLA